MLATSCRSAANSGAAVALASVRRIHPRVREANRLVSRVHTSWGIAEWWSSVEPELGRRPLELVGTPEANAVVRAARARFPDTPPPGS